jgi:hypothetical protein
MLKTLLMGAACAALALSLTACASAGIVSGGAAPTKGAVKAQRDADLAILKEVNRHIETCDRTYSWPFTAVINCTHQTPALTPEAVAEMIDKAVAKAVAALKSPSS